MPVLGLFSSRSVRVLRARVLSSWGYLVGMGFVPLLCLFLIYGAELNPVHIMSGWNYLWCHFVVIAFQQL